MGRYGGPWRPVVAVPVAALGRRPWPRTCRGAVSHIAATALGRGRRGAFRGATGRVGSRVPGPRRLWRGRPCFKTSRLPWRKKKPTRPVSRQVGFRPRMRNPGGLAAGRGPPPLPWGRLLHGRFRCGAPVPLGPRAATLPGPPVSRRPLAWLGTFGGLSAASVPVRGPLRPARAGRAA